MMKAILILLAAVASELVATTSLKLSEGFTKPIPSVAVIIGYGLTFYFLSLALKTMNIGTAYAMWSGLGTVSTAVIGYLIWQENLGIWRVLGIALVIAGVLMLNLCSETAVVA